MRLIDADALEQEAIKRAFEGKLDWSVNDLKQLIRKQPTESGWVKDAEFDDGRIVLELKNLKRW